MREAGTDQTPDRTKRDRHDPTGPSDASDRGAQVTRQGGTATEAREGPYPYPEDGEPHGARASPLRLVIRGVGAASDGRGRGEVLR